MNRKDLRERIETALQDTTNKHWTDAEINRYIDDTLVEFTRVVKQPQVEGYATNPGGGTSLGETTFTDGALTVDGKTANVQHGTPHQFTSGDVVYISGASPDQFNGSHNISVVDANNFSFIVERESDISDGLVDFFRLGPVYTKPSNINEIISVSIDGRELSIYTESELNGQAGSRNNRHFMLESSMGFHPNAFSIAIATVDNTPRWRDSEGPIEAVVFNNRTSDTFRVFPLPKSEADLYVDKTASTKVFHKLKVRGVNKISGLASDSQVPKINSSYHEIIVYGALERAWLKEGQSQDVNKGQVYAQKFQAGMQEALRMEGISGGSLSEGVNNGGLRVNRYL